MTEIFATSDPHFGHKNIIEYCNRPFKDVDHMNYQMMENWNSVVKKDDVVLILGDFALRFEYVEKMAPLLNGLKLLIPGNNDACHPRHKDYKKQAEMYTKAGLVVMDTFEWYTMMPYGITFGMCHFPFISTMSSQDMRYQEWYPKNQDHKNISLMLNGHVHDKWKTMGRCYNVGVDVNDFTPVALDKLARDLTD